MYGGIRFAQAMRVDSKFGHTLKPVLVNPSAHARGADMLIVFELSQISLEARLT